MESEKDILKKHGLKMTPARLGILAFMKHTHAPVAIETIPRSYNGKDTDQSTVYRTINEFLEKGILKKVLIDSTKTFVEFEHVHHHHLVCTDCKKVVEINTCDILAAGEKKILKQSGFARLTEHTLEFFGICANCGTK